jgi:hypothetical protein
MRTANKGTHVTHRFSRRERIYLSISKRSRCVWSREHA